ncbi:MAG: MurR/RpiR family transcriptional regulator [Thermodesulfobacteriota bacterium]
MPFESLILEKMDRLTTAQQRVANFIIEHYDEALFLTVSRLAMKAGVSEATVIRLTQALGFDGYPDMQRMLRENLQNRLSTVTRAEEAIKHAQDDGDILGQVIRQDTQNLAQTLQNIPVETFNQAVKDIRSARAIYVIGLRGAHAPALIFGLYLSFLRKKVHILTPGIGDVWNNILGIGSEDLVLGISFPRYTRLTVELLAYAHEQGTKVGVITDSVMSPLAREADWILPVASRLDSFIESFTASVSVVNALLAAVSIQMPDETVRALRDREALWKEKQIYMTS